MQADRDRRGKCRWSGARRTESSRNRLAAHPPENPAKTNWARPIIEPPFYGYSLRPGVVFTYLGLKVDQTARVAGPAGDLANVWAAGEIMAGSILGQGYLAGFGMTIGTVFGRIAGQEAAKHVG